MEEQCSTVRVGCSCCARLHGPVICCESSSDPELFAAEHDPDVGMLFQHVLDMQNRDVSWDLANEPLSSGGLGLKCSH